MDELVDWCAGNQLYDIFTRLHSHQRNASRACHELGPEELEDSPEVYSALGWWDTLLVRAARCGRTASLLQLVNDNDARGTINTYGDSILYVACLEQKLETVRAILQDDTWRSLLLTHGHRTEPSPFYMRQCLALTVAIEKGNCDIVEVMLQHGAPTDIATSDPNWKNSALQKVVMRWYANKPLMDPALGSKLVRLLAREGKADLEQRVELHMHLWKGDVQLPSKIPAGTEVMGTVLHYACWAFVTQQYRRDHHQAYNRACLLALLREGADVNAHTSDGTSPLDIAYSTQNRKLVKLLTASESDVDEADVQAEDASTFANPSNQERAAKRQRRSTPLAERARRVGVKHKLKSYDGLEGKALKAAQTANQQVVSRAEGAAARQLKDGSSSSSSGQKVLCTTQYGAGPKMAGESQESESEISEAEDRGNDGEERRRGVSTGPQVGKVRYLATCSVLRCASSVTNLPMRDHLE